MAATDPTTLSDGTSLYQWERPSSAGDQGQNNPKHPCEAACTGTVGFITFFSQLQQGGPGAALAETEGEADKVTFPLSPEEYQDLLDLLLTEVNETHDAPDSKQTKSADQLGDSLTWSRLCPNFIHYFIFAVLFSHPPIFAAFANRQSYSTQLPLQPVRSSCRSCSNSYSNTNAGRSQYLTWPASSHTSPPRSASQASSEAHLPSGTAAPSANSKWGLRGSRQFTASSETRLGRSFKKLFRRSLQRPYLAIRSWSIIFQSTTWKCPMATIAKLMCG